MAVEVVVVAHRSVRPLLDQWEAGLTDDPATGRRLADAYWGALEKRIVDAGGRPADAGLDETTRPPTFWVELTGGTRVQCCLKPDEWVGPFRWRRRVVVVNLVFG
jgi:hypothetical protein